MSSSYLPIEACDFEKVTFYVMGTEQPTQGFVSIFYELLGFVTGKPRISLSLVADTDQLSTRGLTEMEKMGQYGRRFLKEVSQIARRKGYIVADTSWDGIIAPSNLALKMEDPNTHVWTFLPEKGKRNK